MKQLIINDSSKPGIDIARAMDQENMSQSRLATISGMARNTIYRYINCDYPMRLEAAERIAKALGADEIIIKVRREI